MKRIVTKGLVALALAVAAGGPARAQETKLNGYLLGSAPNGMA
jgi:hypothetical protein